MNSYVKKNLSSASEKLTTDGNDLGPAPLQNSVAPLETFEGVVDMRSKTKSSCAKAKYGKECLEEHMKGISGVDVKFDDSCEKVTMNQDDVLPTGDFVNMDTTPFAWARAFPTIFIPTYLNGEWVILHDYTQCFNMKQVREVTVNYKDWLQFMMFQSDGVPASHPTFSLVALNHKMKSQLQTQGHYVLNTSNMDPNITGEELLDMWNDKQSGRKELFN